MAGKCSRDICFFSHSADAEVIEPRPKKQKVAIEKTPKDKKILTEEEIKQLRRGPKSASPNHSFLTYYKTVLPEAEWQVRLSNAFVAVLSSSSNTCCRLGVYGYME